MDDLFDPEVLVAAGLTGPITARKVSPYLRAVCKRHGIETPRRVAGFLSQCSVESVGFVRCQENLHYSSPERIRSVFRGFFQSDAEAALYVHRPEALANKVYANRLGNGPAGTGDGWRFRGRGYIQLTGRSHYEAFARASGLDAVGNPDLLASPEGAAESAAWYWIVRPLNEAADALDAKRMTLLVTGPALLGLAEREALFKRALSVFERAVES